MNRTKKQQKHSPARSGVTMLGLAAALLCSAPALASTVWFESLDPEAHLSGATLTENGYNLTLVEGPSGADAGAVSGTGVIVNSYDPTSCFVTVCPTNASGNYLAVINDGAVRLSNSNAGKGFRLSNFDYAFISPVPVAPGDYGLLQLSGVNWQGQTISAILEFPGQDADGNFMFGASDLNFDFRNSIFNSLTINACIYNDDVCTNSLASPAFNQAQFAIDNLDLTDIPEPGSILLAGLGIAALGLARRRKVAPAQGAQA